MSLDHSFGTVGGYTMPISFKDAHFPKELILTGACWYVLYPSSSRNVEELMLERRVSADHFIINRDAIQYSPSTRRGILPSQAPGLSKAAFRRNEFHSKRREGVHFDTENAGKAQQVCSKVHHV